MINKTNERKLFIGLPKCGSTSVQNLLKKSQLRMNSSHWYYMKLLCSSIDLGLDDIALDCANNMPDLIVFEDLLGFSAEKWEKRIAGLNRLFPESKFLVIYREFNEWYRSALFQEIRNGSIYHVPISEESFLEDYSRKKACFDKLLLEIKLNENFTCVDLKDLSNNILEDFFKLTLSTKMPHVHVSKPIIFYEKILLINKLTFPLSFIFSKVMIDRYFLFCAKTRLHKIITIRLLAFILFGYARISNVINKLKAKLPFPKPKTGQLTIFMSSLDVQNYRNEN